MSTIRRIAKHGLAIVAIVAVSTFVYVYSNAYLIHRVLVVDYNEFDAIPDSNGKVTLAQNRTIDFRLPNFTLNFNTIAEVNHAVKDRTGVDSELVAACVGLARTRLNATDSGRPSAETANAETLYRSGTDLFCLCSEHAVLLNEILQASGVDSRVLWLEGHVTAEYFDRDLDQWVFVDASMNTMFKDEAGKPLSASQLIYAMERDHTIVASPICKENGQSHSLTHDSVDHQWYRNVLLNGECYALSGSTLRDPSRWSHLMHFHVLPQMLVLATQYDSSHAKYIEPFKLRKCILICSAFLGGFYALRYLLRPKSINL